LTSTGLLYVNGTNNSLLQFSRYCQMDICFDLASTSRIVSPAQICNRKPPPWIPVVGPFLLLRSLSLHGSYYPQCFSSTTWSTKVGTEGRWFAVDLPSFQFSLLFFSQLSIVFRVQLSSHTAASSHSSLISSLSFQKKTV
jgi:hypothetical protein